MPSGSVIRIPTRAASTWFEVRRAISYRLSKTLGRPVEEIAPGLIVEELLRIAMHHIYVEGYPSPDEVKARQDRQRAELRTVADMATRIDTLEAAVARLRAGADDA